MKHQQNCYLSRHKSGEASSGKNGEKSGGMLAELVARLGEDRPQRNTLCASGVGGRGRRRPRWRWPGSNKTEVEDND